jgi:hypothetical protein
MKMPAKLYERLTPDERFRAFVEAAAHRDEEELDRLNSTCPMKGYRIEDPDYFLPKMHALVVTLSAHVDAEQYAELAGFSMALLMFGDERYEEKAIAGFKTFIRRYRTLTFGFDKFCEGIGVDPDSMRKMSGCGIGPITKMALDLAQDYSDAEPVAEEIESVAVQFLARWRVNGATG